MYSVIKNSTQQSIGLRCIGCQIYSNIDTKESHFRRLRNVMKEVPEQTMMHDEYIPHVISLCLIFVAVIAIIIYGYFHGNMHLLTTLKNAYTS